MIIKNDVLNFFYSKNQPKYPVIGTKILLSVSVSVLETGSIHYNYVLLSSPFLNTYFAQIFVAKFHNSRFDRKRGRYEMNEINTKPR